MALQVNNPVPQAPDVQMANVLPPPPNPLPQPPQAQGVVVYKVGSAKYRCKQQSFRRKKNGGYSQHTICRPTTRWNGPTAEEKTIKQLTDLGYTVAKKRTTKSCCKPSRGVCKRTCRKKRTSVKLGAVWYTRCDGVKVHRRK